MDYGLYKPHNLNQILAAVVTTVFTIMSMDISDNDCSSMDMSEDETSSEIEEDLDIIIADTKVNKLKNCVGNLLQLKCDLCGSELKERVINDVIEMEHEHRIFFKSHYELWTDNKKQICHPSDEQKKNYLIEFIFANVI